MESESCHADFGGKWGARSCQSFRKTIFFRKRLSATWTKLSRPRRMDTDMYEEALRSPGGRSSILGWSDESKEGMLHDLGDEDPHDGNAPTRSLARVCALFLMKNLGSGTRLRAWVHATSSHAVRACRPSRPRAALASFRAKSARPNQ